MNIEFESRLRIKFLNCEGELALIIFFDDTNVNQNRRFYNTKKDGHRTILESLHDIRFFEIM